MVIAHIGHDGGLPPLPREYPTEDDGQHRGNEIQEQLSLLWQEIDQGEHSYMAILS